jgi:hypothetical protein
MNTTLDLGYINGIIKNHKENSIYGRWIRLSDVEKALSKFENSSYFSSKIIGCSEELRNIHEVTIGNGSKKILIWTQMHGNESTGTKAVIDLINYLYKSKDKIRLQILTNATIKIIPLLNPDGAEYYTRYNANSIDLNRDAVNKDATESKVLRKVLDDFKPHFCFNLHDQRTIFGVEGENKPATISFLAPSEESSRKVTNTRIKTMNVICSMNNLLQEIIPGQVARYSDEFYPTATGDNFQKLGFPTILIESGHFKDDYQRETVRNFTFMSILQGIYHISSVRNFNDYQDYFKIPNNVKNFGDLLHIYPNKENVGYLYEEILEENLIKFIPKMIKEDISNLLFHKEIDFVR